MLKTFQKVSRGRVSGNTKDHNPTGPFKGLTAEAVKWLAGQSYSIYFMQVACRSNVNILSS
jgi:hypothetical protein